MGLGDFKDTVERKVWKSSGGTDLLVVSGLLSPGKYEITKKKNKEGKQVLVFEEINE